MTDHHEVVAVSLEGKGVFGEVAVTLIKPAFRGNGLTKHGLCGLPGPHLQAGPHIESVGPIGSVMSVESETDVKKALTLQSCGVANVMICQV